MECRRTHSMQAQRNKMPTGKKNTKCQQHKKSVLSKSASSVVEKQRLGCTQQAQEKQCRETEIHIAQPERKQNTVNGRKVTEGNGRARAQKARNKGQSNLGHKEQEGQKGSWE